MTTTRVDEGGLHDADDDLPDGSTAVSIDTLCTTRLYIAAQGNLCSR